MQQQPLAKLFVPESPLYWFVVHMVVWQPPLVEEAGELELSSGDVEDDSVEPVGEVELTSDGEPLMSAGELLIISDGDGDIILIVVVFWHE